MSDVGYWAMPDTAGSCLTGGGIPLLPCGPRLPLRLRAHRLYATTGTMFLEYDVQATGSGAAAP